MLTFLSVIHIIIGLGLVAFVLLQDPKGGAAGVFGGGSSSTSFFGASGASNFLTITTKWLAILFAISCLALTMATSRGNKSVMDDPSLAAPVAPVAPSPLDGKTPVPAQPSAPEAVPAQEPVQKK